MLFELRFWSETATNVAYVGSRPTRLITFGRSSLAVAPHWTIFRRSVVPAMPRKLGGRLGYQPWQNRRVATAALARPFQANCVVPVLSMNTDLVSFRQRRSSIADWSGSLLPPIRVGHCPMPVGEMLDRTTWL